MKGSQITCAVYEIEMKMDAKTGLRCSFDVKIAGRHGRYARYRMPNFKLKSIQLSKNSGLHLEFFYTLWYNVIEYLGKRLEMTLELVT